MRAETMISFVTHCPQCNMEVLPLFEPNHLLARLQNERASFYCISCDYHWKPDVQECRNLTIYLKQTLGRTHSALLERSYLLASLDDIA